MWPARLSAKPLMLRYLLRARSESVSGVPSSTSTTFLLFSHCSPWFPPSTLAAREFPDRAVFDLPVRGGHSVVPESAPAVECLAIEQQTPARALLVCRQGIRLGEHPCINHDRTLLPTDRCCCALTCARCRS